MRRAAIALLAAVVVSVVSACTGDIGQDEVAQTDTIVGVVGPLDLAVEHVSELSARPGVIIHLVTRDTFPCIGYSIEAKPAVQDTQVAVNILGARTAPGDYCLPEMAPADFGDTLALPPGQYAFDITYVYTDRYRLVVGDSVATLIPLEVRFTQSSP